MQNICRRTWKKLFHLKWNPFNEVTKVYRLPCLQRCFTAVNNWENIQCACRRQFFNRVQYNSLAKSKMQNISSASSSRKQRQYPRWPSVRNLTLFTKASWIYNVLCYYSACRRRGGVLKCPRFCFFFRCRKLAQRSWVIPLAQAAWADLNTAFKLNF